MIAVTKTKSSEYNGHDSRNNINININNNDSNHNNSNRVANGSISLDSSIHDIQQQVSRILDMIMIIGVDHDVYGSDDSDDYEHDNIDGDDLEYEDIC